MLDSSKLEEFADDNFKFDENGRMFSKRVENTVGKGEIARYVSNFAFSHCVFKRHVKNQGMQTRKNQGMFGKRLILLIHNYLLFTTQSRLLTTLKEKAFENIVGKGENAGNQHFLLFPQCFLPFPKQISIFQLHSICRLQMLSIWTSLKFCCVVKS